MATTAGEADGSAGGCVVVRWADAVWCAAAQRGECEVVADRVCVMMASSSAGCADEGKASGGRCV